jgi:hypothetical protein
MRDISADLLNQLYRKVYSNNIENGWNKYNTEIDYASNGLPNILFIHRSVYELSRAARNHVVR